MRIWTVILIAALTLTAVGAVSAQQYDDRTYGTDENHYYGPGAGDNEAQAAVEEAEASRRALERALMEIVSLRRELEAARAEIDRIRGGAAAPVSVEVRSAPIVRRRAIRTHTVAAGETLGTISTRYYGTPSRFQEIFEANRNILTSPDLIIEGQTLVIP